MLIGCVVMASGEGRRFSDVPGAKLLAPVAGTPLVERTVRSVPRGVLAGSSGGLLPGFDVVVATRWPAVAELACTLGVGCMLHGGSERSASVRAGLEFGAMRWDGCLFVPGDQQLVLPENYARLAEAVIADPDVCAGKPRALSAAALRRASRLGRGRRRTVGARGRGTRGAG